MRGNEGLIYLLFWCLAERPCQQEALLLLSSGCIFTRYTYTNAYRARGPLETRLIYPVAICLTSQLAVGCVETTVQKAALVTRETCDDDETPAMIYSRIRAPVLITPGVIGGELLKPEKKRSRSDHRARKRPGEIDEKLRTKQKRSGKASGGGGGGERYK